MMSVVFCNQDFQLCWYLNVLHVLKDVKNCVIQALSAPDRDNLYSNMGEVLTLLIA